MIEINLIPNVKLEYLKANKQRRMVISISIITAIASVAIVVLLGFYAFGVQSIAGVLADNSIKSENEKLMNVEDLSKTLTIQKQLDGLSSQHDAKTVSSRLLDIISTTVPTGKNAITIDKITLNTSEKLIEIEGQAPNGYEALEVFKKTIAQTKFGYTEEGEVQPDVNIASTIIDGERRYGEDSEGKNVLRFALSFVYSEQLFSKTSDDGTVIAPNKQNATDSAKGVPRSLFSSGGNS